MREAALANSPHFSPFPEEIGMALAKAESTPDANARCRCPSSRFAAESLFRIRSQVARSLRGPLPFPGGSTRWIFKRATMSRQALLESLADAPVSAAATGQLVFHSS